jgi:hypothetical protein
LWFCRNRRAAAEKQQHRLGHRASESDWLVLPPGA